MHSIRIHKVVGLLISLFYCMSFWHRGRKPTVKEIRLKFFFCLYHSLFVLSLAVGAIRNEKKDHSIFLAELSIGTAVLAVKFWLLIWKQYEILHLLDRVCVFSIRNDDDHNRFNIRLRGFMKFVIVFVIAVTFAGFLSSVVVTFLGGEKTLFLEIGFPLDYKSSVVAFWIAFVFLFTEIFLSIIIIIFTIVIWYLLFICALRYEILGSGLQKMRRIGEKEDRKMTNKLMQKQFFDDMKSLIGAHLYIREVTIEVQSFFADLFLIQFATSGLCICGSIYCLAFDVGDNVPERLVYLIAFFYYFAELFMITYFGNEIMMSSGRLSYSLFESDWYDQPQSTQKCIIIFGEYLKQPQVLVVGKLYPLTLATFTRILNSAYSMFNILKSFQ